MSNLSSGIEKGSAIEEVEQVSDPELRDDRDLSEVEDIEEVDLPEYDESQFELPDDFEYQEEVEE